MRGMIRVIAAAALACAQSIAQQSDLPISTMTGSSTTSNAKTTTSSPVTLPAPVLLNGSDPGPLPLTNEPKKKEVRAFNKRAQGPGGGEFGDRGAASKGGSFLSRTGGLRATKGTGGGASSSSASKGGSKTGTSKGVISTSKGPALPTAGGGTSSSDGSNSNEDTRSASRESPCEAVANATYVSDSSNTVVDTYQMEMHVIATTYQAKSMRWKLRIALQQSVAPDLTSCAAGAAADASSSVNATRVRHERRHRRALQAGVFNVVFGPLQVKDMRECPDPSGAHGQASCLRTVGNVSVYRQDITSDGSANASWSDDNSFPADLTNRTEALDGITGLIDIFSCTVTPLWNATDPVPEGSGRTNETQANATTSTQTSTSRSASTSGLSASAAVGIAIVAIIVVLVGLFLVRHQRRRQQSRQRRPFAPMKDGGEDSSSTGYDSTDDAKLAQAGSMKILGPARDDVDAAAETSGTVEVVDCATNPIHRDAGIVQSHDDELPTVEKRVIDPEGEHVDKEVEAEEEGDDDGPNDDDTRDVEIIPVFRLVTALDINPPEDDQSLMSMEREKRNYE